MAVLGPQSPCKSWAGIRDNDIPSNHASNKTLRLPRIIMREQKHWKTKLKDASGFPWGR